MLGTDAVTETGGAVDGDEVDAGGVGVFFGAVAGDFGVVEECLEDTGDKDEEAEDGDRIVVGGDPEDDEDFGREKLIGLSSESGREPLIFAEAALARAAAADEDVEDEAGPMPKSEPMRSHVRVNMARGLFFGSNWKIDARFRD